MVVFFTVEVLCAVFKPGVIVMLFHSSFLNFFVNKKNYIMAIAILSEVYFHSNNISGFIIMQIKCQGNLIIIQ